MIDTLLIGASVVTMDPQRSVYEDGAIAVDRGRIAAVGPANDLARRYQARERVDCRGKAIIPGLVDAHGHGGHSLLKTIGCEMPSLWMRIVTPVYFHFVTAEFWYADGLLGALERLRFGVTCGVNVIGSQPRSDDPAFGISHARGYGEVGVRGIVAVGPCAPPWPHPVSDWVDGARVRREVSLDAALAGAEAVIEACHHSFDDRIRAVITPFTIVPSVNPSGPTPADLAAALTESDRMQARRIREIAERHKTRIHSDAFGGMVALAARDECALLGPDVHLQHCLALSMEEIRILADTGTHVTHAPGPFQMHGRCPVPELMDAGVNVAITTDGTAPSTSFDLFQAMRKTKLIQQLATRDPFLLPAGKLLEMVTIDAARAIGWNDEIGSLEPGKHADLAIVDLRQPHLTPHSMIVHRLVHEAVGNDVQSVMVAGKWVMRERRALAVDETSILDRADSESRAVIARAGLEPFLHDPGWGQVRRRFEGEVPLPD